MIIGAAAYRDHGATRIWKERVVPRIGAGLRKSVLQKAVSLDVRTPSGLYVGKTTRLEFDAKRISRVTQRIVQGLLWHHYQRLLVQGSTIEIHYQPDLEQMSELFQLTTLSKVGDTTFKYWHGLAEDGPESSLWVLEFYGVIRFLVVVFGAGVDPNADDPT